MANKPLYYRTSKEQKIHNCIFTQSMNQTQMNCTAFTQKPGINSPYAPNQSNAITYNTLRDEASVWIGHTFSLWDCLTSASLIYNRSTISSNKKFMIQDIV